MKAPGISSYARDQARARLKQFLAAQRHARGHLDDAESIHDLRVSIRRLTQCLKIFNGLFAPGPVKKFHRRLKKLMDRCADVRNCDIATELLHQAGSADGPSIPNLKVVRKDAAHTLQNHVNRSHRRRKSKWMKGLQLELQEGSEWVLGETVAENLARILPGMAADFFAAGRAALAKGSHYHSLHQFRLRTKRFRYALELFPDFYANELPARLQLLRGLQDLLGAINDCVTTIPLLGKDRQGTSAVRLLLKRREGEFRRFYRLHYPPQAEADWISWLSSPRKS